MSSFFDTFALNRRQQTAAIIILVLILAGAIARHHLARSRQLTPQPVSEGR